ncbi:MAG TPA: peptidase M16, partial [Desulfobacteraceae bacterium]|nr:peptidase M16 [Desulfobacteraceae bacterium]
QIYFSTGLKGINTEDADRIEHLILDTLSRLSCDGIDPLTIEAAINTIEFRLRENNSASFPQGLLLMLRSLTTWLYNGDPLSLLKFEEPLKRIKHHINSGNSFFEDMIKRYLLDNRHRSTVIFKPDSGLQEKEEKAEKEFLARTKSKMSDDDIKNAMRNTIELRRRQEAPDSPEALSTIPFLRLSDLERKEAEIPLTIIKEKDTRILFHDLPTSGIVYLDIGFDLQTLPETYLPFVPLFGRALVEMGTEREDFVLLTQRISRKTGGIYPVEVTSAARHSGRGVQMLFLRGKAMQKRGNELTRIVRDITLGVNLDNQERFRQMVMEEKARMEKSIIPQGHQIVNLRLRSNFNHAFRVAEQIGGISYLFFLRELSRLVEEKWPDVLFVLRQLKRILINTNSSVFNVSLDEKGFTDFQPHLNELISALPEFPPEKPDWHHEGRFISEAMTMPSQVNFVGKGADLSSSGYRFHGSALVISRYLRNAWLWDRIRVQGGAYGAFCLFDRLSSILTFVSYRDPNLEETLAAFDHSAQFLRESDFNEKEIEKSITGAIGDIDAHMLPDAKGYASMIRYLTGNSDEILQQMRDEILSTRLIHFRAFAEQLDHVKEKGIIKVLGSRDAVDKALSKSPGLLEVLEVM